MGKLSKFLDAVMNKKPGKESPKAKPTVKAAATKATAPAKKATSLKTPPVRNFGKPAGKVPLKTVAGKGAKALPVPTPVELKVGKKGAKGGKSPQKMPVATHENRTICRVIGCLLPATTGGYSRICYIKYWKTIKKKDEILKDGVVHKYIKEIIEKYPEKVVLAIRHDLSNDEAYAQMIRELDLYGGVDELEHEITPEDELAAEEAIDDIKSNITKDDEEF